MALEITDANFEEIVLKIRKASSGRFLGRMVRSLSYGWST